MVIKTGVFSISIGVLRLLVMLSRLILPNVIKSSGNIKNVPERTQPVLIFSPSLLVSHAWMSFFVTAWPMLLGGLICEILTRNLLLVSHGQASVEQGFSTKKEIAVENMAEQTLIVQ